MLRFALIGELVAYLHFLNNPIGRFPCGKSIQKMNQVQISVLHLEVQTLVLFPDGGSLHFWEVSLLLPNIEWETRMDSKCRPVLLSHFLVVDLPEVLSVQIMLLLSF